MIPCMSLLRGTPKPGRRWARVPALAAAAAAAVALTAGTAGMALAAAVPSPTPAPSTCQFTGGLYTDRLVSVSAVSASDAWAVGYCSALGASGGGAIADVPLTEHWNGHAWTYVKIADPSGEASSYSYLQGVSALSPSDVWAVGQWRPLDGSTHYVLLERWNGHAWVQGQFPNGISTGALCAVDAVSASDVWVVGTTGEITGGENACTTAPTAATAGKTLVLHYNGHTWKRVPSQNAPGATLNDLAAVSSVPGSKQVWAVGESLTSTASGTLAEEWNGTAWKIVHLPVTAAACGSHACTFLASVAATSTSNVWFGGENNGQLLAARWNGTKWALDSPVGNGANGHVGLVGGMTVVPGTSDLWAINGGNAQTAIYSWDGHTWILAASPNPSSAYSYLQAVSATSASDVWAVGYYSNSSSCAIDCTLAEQWNGHTWKILPTPNP